MVSIVKQQVRSKKVGRIVIALFFSVFAIVGGGLLYPFGIRPVMKTIAAQNWRQTPCRIISAEVKSHDSDDGTTYSVYIVYEYEYSGRKYRSDKYGFVKFSSSGYKNKARVVDSYKNNANPVCFVNPDNPSEAVLKRGFHLGLLTALFPLPFLAAGLGGLYWTIKSLSRKDTKPWLPKSPADLATGVLRVSDASTGPLILKPKTSPAARLAGVFILAAFWNGVVSVFVVKVIQGWLSGDGKWGLTLFMIPFVVIGLLIIVGFIYSFLALFNPRPVLAINNSRLTTGSNVRLDWSFSGRVEKIQTLSILLRAKEEATYRTGKNQHTDTNVFFQKEVYSSQTPLSVSFGQAGFDIPSETMHSFEADHNKILWEILVRGSIESWLDVREEFKITVLPAEV